MKTLIYFICDSHNAELVFLIQECQHFSSERHKPRSSYNWPNITGISKHDCQYQRRGTVWYFGGRGIIRSANAENVWTSATATILLQQAYKRRRNRDSSFCIATNYELAGRGVGVRVPAWQNFSLLHSVQTSSGAHPASYPMVTEGSFPGGKAAGT
jgi:hypothetical protein